MKRLASSQLVRGLVVLVLMLSMPSSTMANVAVQDFDTHLEDAGTVLTGIVREGQQGQIILVVETSLKGEGKPNDEIIIDENSKLAWRHIEGGGMVPPINYAEFVQQIQEADWYHKRVVLVGSIKDGKWISYCYDWSVWTSGVSTRNEALKDLSFEELVEVIKSRVGTPEASNLKKTATQAEKVERTDHATPAPKNIPETKQMVSTSIEKLSSSTPWAVVAVVVVAAIGLLVFLLKQRS